MKHLVHFLLVLGALTLSSCMTMECPELTLDLRNATIPVMLNQAPSAATMPLATFSSGRQTASATSTTRSGGMMVSSSVSVTSNVNTPLSNQLLPVFLLNPAAIYIANMKVQEEYLCSFGFINESTILSIDAKIKR